MRFDVVALSGLVALVALAVVALLAAGFDVSLVAAASQAGPLVIAAAVITGFAVRLERGRTA